MRDNVHVFTRCLQLDLLMKSLGTFLDASRGRYSGRVTLDLILLIGICDTAPVLDPREQIPNKSKFIESHQPMGKDDRTRRGIVFLAKLGEVMFDGVSQVRDLGVYRFLFCAIW